MRERRSKRKCLDENASPLRMHDIEQKRLGVIVPSDCSFSLRAYLTSSARTISIRTSYNGYRTRARFANTWALIGTLIPKKSLLVAPVVGLTPQQTCWRADTQCRSEDTSCCCQQSRAGSSLGEDTLKCQALYRLLYGGISAIYLQGCLGSSNPKGLDISALACALLQPPPACTRTCRTKLHCRPSRDPARYYCLP